jgi:hypothetical protein
MSIRHHFTPNDQGKLISVLTTDSTAEAATMLAAPQLLGALAEMIDVFDHVGLRGLVCNAVADGWTTSHVDRMFLVCQTARVAISKARSAEKVQP